MSEEIKLVISG